MDVRKLQQVINDCHSLLGGIMMRLVTNDIDRGKLVKALKGLRQRIDGLLKDLGEGDANE